MEEEEDDARARSQLQMTNSTWQRTLWYDSLDAREFPYTSVEIERILARRQKHVNQTLFFDLLFTRVLHGSNVTNLYPPRDVSQAKQLINQIQSSQQEELQRFCCLYYLAKDWKEDVRYAQQMLLPLNFGMLIDAYWHLDRLELHDALRILSHPSVNPNFPEKIMKTMVQLASSRTVGAQLSLRFFESKRPQLASEEDCFELFSATLAVNPRYCFSEQRKYPAAQRIRLFRRWVKAVVSNAEPYHRSGRSSDDRESSDGEDSQPNDTYRRNCSLILSLPFDETESRIFLELAHESEGLLRELAIVRLLHLGNYECANELLEYYRSGVGSQHADKLMYFLRDQIKSPIQQIMAAQNDI